MGTATIKGSIENVELKREGWKPNGVVIGYQMTVVWQVDNDGTANGFRSSIQVPSDSTTPMPLPGQEIIVATQWSDKKEEPVDDSA